MVGPNGANGSPSIPEDSFSLESPVEDKLELKEVFKNEELKTLFQAFCMKEL
jgi:hypothetical protein